MKKLVKSLIVTILGWQVRRLRAKNSFKIVAVAGSVGKTSTKFAIASILAQSHKVCFQEGNYNDLISVPLIFFGQPMPKITNPFAWVGLFIRNERQLLRSYPYDVVVVELGTDGPSQIKQFGRYIQANFGVLTAIAPEHMQFFAGLDDVAHEELAVASLSEELLVNIDLCPEVYRDMLTENYIRYATKQAADYQVKDVRYTASGYDFDILERGKILMHTTHELIAETQLYSVCAAAALGRQFGMDPSAIEAGIRQIKPVSGRMQRFQGINQSTIIDDTYNASPGATKAALDTLYRINAPQKIAILGSMNELGKYSELAHTEVGEYCDPEQLNLVITIGSDATEYLAPAAQKNGCNVKTFVSPYQAGEYLKPLIRSGAIILAKGSQNGVFAEETIKQLLANSADAHKLVRQSPHWLAIKKKAFKAS